MSDIASIVLYLRQIEMFQGKFLVTSNMCWELQRVLHLVAGAAALFYDYLLGFGSEVDLIWKWNLVTLLYAVVRYLSFPLLVNSALYMGSVNWTGQDSISNVERSKVSKPKLNHTSYYHRCLVWYQIRMWGPYIYRIAMDVIMMQRIRALSTNPMGRFVNASKWVLIVMVISCIATWASNITLLMLGIGPGRHLTSGEYEFAGTFICGTMIPNSGFLMSANIPAFCFELLLFVLAIGYFAVEVWEDYQQEKRWKVSGLRQILARDSIIYFALNVAATALDIGIWQVNAPDIFMAASASLQSFIPFCLSPRLIINIKWHRNRGHI
ncbi:hypothetical protein BDN67DRAFT_1015086 [Paxillus ammoniavirescens]|nr:hypothetical protein BDN67DRAFT_1015086 [Paxillus ammoniavirescens]